MGKFKLVITMAVFVLMLAACSGNAETEKKETEDEEVESAEAATVEINDAHGTIEVPINPEKVIVLDNRSFQTLADWDIELVAVPKGVMTDDSPYVTNEEVVDIGNHREPNLELLAAEEPELIIVGQRFAGYYDEIKKLVPDAVVIDIDVDTSEEATTPGENLVNGLKDNTIILGQIFDKNEEAEKLVTEFDEAVENTKSAYNEEDTVMGVIVSGGDIGFSAPGSGRVWGPMYEIFGWTPALEVEESSSDHQGDEVSVEAIAESNPDWIFALDRDAPLSSVTDKLPAQDVIDESPALQDTTAITKEQIIYAPTDTYLNESIQTYLKLFDDIEKALDK